MMAAEAPKPTPAVRELVENTKHRLRASPVHGAQSGPQPTAKPVGTVAKRGRARAAAKPTEAPEPTGAPDDGGQAVTGVVVPAFTTRAGLPTPPEGWAEYILDAKSRIIGAYFELGQRLIRAKISVGHGEWLPLLRAVGIGEDSAERYMRIAGHDTWQDSAYVRNLPTTMMAAYELSNTRRISPDGLIRAIKDGAVTSDITLHDAKAVVRQYGVNKTSSKPKPSGTRPRLSGAMTGNALAVAKWLNSIPTVDALTDYAGEFSPEKLLGYADLVADALAVMRAIAERVDETQE